MHRIKPGYPPVSEQRPSRYLRAREAYSELPISGSGDLILREMVKNDLPLLLEGNSDPTGSVTKA